MNKSNAIISTAAALVAVIAIGGFAYFSFAQNASSFETESASVSAEAGFKGGGHDWKSLTDEQRAALEARRAARQKEMEARREEMGSAIQRGYSSWVEAVKNNMGENAPILSQVNEENFGKFSEAHEYMEKGRAIMQEIGVGREFGGRRMFGGEGKGIRGNCAQ